MEKGFQAVNLHGCASGKIATPVIGENGNWYIGHDDTGISARGEQGEPGEPGTEGLQGPKGDRGEAGPAGPQGIQGITGEKGEKGDVGQKGDAGEVGPQGPKGDAGEIGSQGPKGDAGETGPQGSKGDTPELAANLEETIEGKALDATMGKVLNDNLGGNVLIYENGKYYIQRGADSASKKQLAKKGISFTHAGSGWMSPNYDGEETSITIDIKSHTNDYSTLSSNNFIVGVSSWGASGNRTSGATIYVSSYNSATGTLIIKSTMNIRYATIQICIIV